MPFDEAAFREWYRQRAEQTGLNPDPDDPRHGYDYREAFRRGYEPKRAEDGSYHWSSAAKTASNPRRLLAGDKDTSPEWSGKGRAYDTINERWVSEGEAKRMKARPTSNEMHAEARGALVGGMRSGE